MKILNIFVKENFEIFSLVPSQVMFTGYNDQKDVDMVDELGGVVTELTGIVIIPPVIVQ